MRDTGRGWMGNIPKQNADNPKVKRGDRPQYGVGKNAFVFVLFETCLKLFLKRTVETNTFQSFSWLLPKTPLKAAIAATELATVAATISYGDDDDCHQRAEAFQLTWTHATR